jgi:hypothetical protein
MDGFMIYSGAWGRHHPDTEAAARRFWRSAQKSQSSGRRHLLGEIRKPSVPGVMATPPRVVTSTDDLKAARDAWSLKVESIAPNVAA